MTEDLFEDGYVDMAIFQPTYLTDFYHKGFNTTEQDAVSQGQVPGQVRPQLPPSSRGWGRGRPGPVRGEGGQVRLQGREAVHGRVARPPPRAGSSPTRGPSRHLEKRPGARRHQHPRPQGPDHLAAQPGLLRPGPTSTTPLSTFPELNFIVEHVGLPRLEDMCWIGTQEPNVYGGLAVAMPFIHTRPALLRPDRRGAAVLAGRGPPAVRQRLRPGAQAPQVAGREVRRLPDTRWRGTSTRSSPPTSRRRSSG